jgi:deoxyribodipyrimidine photolyase-related protein
MTTLYWHFLDRHEDSLMKNPRTSLMARNIGRLDPSQRESGARAAYVLANLDDL